MNREGELWLRGSKGGLRNAPVMRRRGFEFLNTYGARADGMLIFKVKRPQIS
jgi:hypothetical protein